MFHCGKGVLADDFAVRNIDPFRSDVFGAATEEQPWLPHDFSPGGIKFL